MEDKKKIIKTSTDGIETLPQIISESLDLQISRLKGVDLSGEGHYFIKRIMHLSKSIAQMSLATLSNYPYVIQSEATDIVLATLQVARQLTMTYFSDMDDKMLLFDIEQQLKEEKNETK